MQKLNLKNEKSIHKTICMVRWNKKYFFQTKLKEKKKKKIKFNVHSLPS